MMKTDKMNKRKGIRLKNYDYSSSAAYFVTICTDKKKNIFWNGNLDTQMFTWRHVGANCVRPHNLPLSGTGEIVLNELERWNETYDSVSLSWYVIMPNHLHVMVVISPGEYGRPQVAPTLDRMVKQFKGSVTKKAGMPIWQKSFYDHVIRNRQDYEDHVKYIYDNPIHWVYDEMYSTE
jgi:REP element-mobilizing transposase RayT